MKRKKNSSVLQLDEKENMQYQEKDANLMDIDNTINTTMENPIEKLDSQVDLLDDENNDYIISLSQYWPEGMKNSAKNLSKNKNLIFLYSSNGSSCGVREISELTPWYKYYSNVTATEIVPLDDHPKAFYKYVVDIPRKFNLSIIKTESFLRHEKCLNGRMCATNLESENPILKFYENERSMHYYFNLDEEKFPKVPQVFFKDIYKSLTKKYFANQFTFLEPESTKLSDTSDFPEAQVPEGFEMTLRDYQLRTISWMKSIESVENLESNTIFNNFLPNDMHLYAKFKLGESPYYLGLNDNKVTISTSPKAKKLEKLRLYGGILADNTGSGKTITTLGLIHAAPFTEAHKLNRLKRFSDINNFIQSRASCVICASNIFKQWKDEAKRCNPKFKIIGLSNIYDHRNISWKDMAEADIVIVSYQFLLNSNYAKVVSLKSAEAEWSKHKTTKGRVVLSNVHFHRTIFDEYHELRLTKASMCSAVKRFRADNFWGLTGTPSFDNTSNLHFLNAPERINEVYDQNQIGRREIIRKYVKRNILNCELPPIEQETIWIDLSASELSLMKMKITMKTSIKEQIMMCAHYQLTENGPISVDEFIPVEEVHRRMSVKKESDVRDLEMKVSDEKRRIEALIIADPKADVTYFKTQLKNTETRLDNAQRSLNYYLRVFGAISEPDNNECGICYDFINSTGFGFLPCAHLFCYSCVLPHVEKAHECPQCRFKIQVSDIFKMRIVTQEALPDSLNKLDTSKYSCKLISLYRYLVNLLESDKNARVILFLQFKDLANFMAKTFKELNFECARVSGTVFQRINAIEQFQHSQDVRMIMMSSEDNVSGINLTQATHVILLHPFWTGKGEGTDLAYEKQGISRAYRFGLNHPLKIVRFAVRGTAEESITKSRVNIKL